MHLPGHQDSSYCPNWTDTLDSLPPHSSFPLLSLPPPPSRAILKSSPACGWAGAIFSSLQPYKILVPRLRRRGSESTAQSGTLRIVECGEIQASGTLTFKMGGDSEAEKGPFLLSSSCASKG